MERFTRDFRYSRVAQKDDRPHGKSAGKVERKRAGGSYSSEFRARPTVRRFNENRMKAAGGERKPPPLSSPEETGRKKEKGKKKKGEEEWRRKRKENDAIEDLKLEPDRGQRGQIASIEIISR